MTLGDLVRIRGLNKVQVIWYNSHAGFHRKPIAREGDE